jgi:hypothetical protein
VSAVGAALTALGLAGIAGCAGATTESAAAGSAEAALAAEPSAPSAPATPTPTPTPEPLVTTTPDEHSEVGRLAPGFPIDLLPVPDDAVILVTSAEPIGDAAVQEVSLNLHTSMTADAVLELYRTALTAAGFSEVATAGAGLTAEASFTRSGGDELVSIGVLDDGATRTVTIGGRVRVGAEP